MKKFLFLFSLLLSVRSNCEEVQNVQTPEKFEAAKIWIGVPVGAWLGFGIGHGLQDRFVKDYGWAYAVADSVGFGLIFSAFGDCVPAEACSDEKDQRMNAGKAVLITSRIIQVADLSIWSYNYYKKHRATVFLLPGKDHINLTAALTF